jgi:hypothetical protein
MTGDPWALRPTLADGLPLSWTQYRFAGALTWQARLFAAGPADFTKSRSYRDGLQKEFRLFFAPPRRAFLAGNSGLE